MQEGSAHRAAVDAGDGAIRKKRRTWSRWAIVSGLAIALSTGGLADGPPAMALVASATLDARILETFRVDHYEFCELNLPEGVPESFEVSVERDGRRIRPRLERHSVRGPD